MHLTDYIKFQMNKGRYVGMILLYYLLKAFATVNHNIFVKETEGNGIDRFSYQMDFLLFK